VKMGFEQSGALVPVLVLLWLAVAVALLSRQEADALVEQGRPGIKALVLAVVAPAVAAVVAAAAAVVVASFLLIPVDREAEMLEGLLQTTMALQAAEVAVAVVAAAVAAAVAVLAMAPPT
jgi:hypothetical protein